MTGAVNKQLNDENPMLKNVHVEIVCRLFLLPCCRISWIGKKSTTWLLLVTLRLGEFTVGIRGHKGQRSFVKGQTLHQFLEVKCKISDVKCKNQRLNVKC